MSVRACVLFVALVVLPVALAQPAGRYLVQTSYATSACNPQIMQGFDILRVGRSRCGVYAEGGSFYRDCNSTYATGYVCGNNDCTNCTVDPYFGERQVGVCTSGEGYSMYSCVDAPSSGYLYTFLRGIGNEANPFNIAISLGFEDSSISPSCDLNSDKLSTIATPFISSPASITCQPLADGYKITFCNSSGVYEQVCSDSLCRSNCVTTYAYGPSDYYNCTGGGGQFSKNICLNPYAPAPPSGSTAPSSSGGAPTNAGNNAPNDGGSNAPNGGGSNAPNGGGSNTPSSVSNAPSSASNAPNGGGSNTPSSGSNAPNGGSNGAPSGTNTKAPAAPVAPKTPSSDGSSKTAFSGVIAALVCIIAVFNAL